MERMHRPELFTGRMTLLPVNRRSGHAPWLFSIAILCQKIILGFHGILLTASVSPRAFFQGGLPVQAASAPVRKSSGAINSPRSRGKCVGIVPARPSGYFLRRAGDSHRGQPGSSRIIASLLSRTGRPCIPKL